MLSEFIDYLTTPCPSEARKLGYLREAVSIRSRYRRQKGHWEPHLYATKKIILEAISLAPNNHRVVILGSGGLYDVPIKALSCAFDKVDLFDLVHPKEAYHAAAQFSNVTLYTQDLSNVVETLASLSRGEDYLPESVDLQLPSAYPDLIVSVNLLSQLPNLPFEWLKKHTNVSDENAKRFCGRIVQRHLHWLISQDCPACLISDINRYYISPDGNVHNTWDSLYGVVMPAGGQTWRWQIAPAGENHPSLAVGMTVRGFADFRYFCDEMK